MGDKLRRKFVVGIGIIILIFSPILMLSSEFLKYKFIIVFISFSLEGVGNALLSGADDALFYEGIRQDGQSDNYGKIRGNVQFFKSISTGIATFLGGGMYFIYYGLPYIMQSIFMIMALVLIISFKDKKLILKKESVDNKQVKMFSHLLVFKNMTKNKNVLFIFLFTTLIVGMINSIFSFLPDYISKLGYNSSENGAIFMIYSFIGGFIATKSYKLTKLGYNKLIFIVISLVSVGLFFQIQNNKVIFLVGICFLYIIVDILDPICMEMLNVWVKDSVRATFISGLSFSISLITMILNPLIGLTISEFGTVSMLIIYSIFTVFMVLLSLIMVNKSKKYKDL